MRAERQGGFEPTRASCLRVKGIVQYHLELPACELESKFLKISCIARKVIYRDLLRAIFSTFNTTFSRGCFGLSIGFRVHILNTC